MKTVIKLLVALALLNAVFRGAMAQWNYYQLKDGTQELLTFAEDASPEQLQAQILEQASSLNIPLDADNVDVRRDGQRSSAAVSYTQPVEFFPSYVYPMQFSFVVDAVSLRAGAPKRRR